MNAMERLKKLKKARPDLFEDNPTKACIDMYTEMRAENEKLKSELDSCGHAIVALEQERNELQKELTALKTAPKCPKCGSKYVGCLPFHDDGYFAACDNCALQGSVEASLDAALDAWRPSSRGILGN